jgi:hypothetical protein
MFLFVAAAVGQDPALEKVLGLMDQQAANFRNAQATFLWDQYTKAVEEHDIQEGTFTSVVFLSRKCRCPPPSPNTMGSTWPKWFFLRTDW